MQIFIGHQIVLFSIKLGLQGEWPAINMSIYIEIVDIELQTLSAANNKSRYQHAQDLILLQSIPDRKMKYSLVILLLAVLSVAYSQPCSDAQNCELPADSQITAENIYPFIDYQLKQNYWQYLRNANLIYRAGVNRPESILFLSIYRNIVGTFLVITTWTFGETVAQVNTFVRLGNGYSQDSGARYGPVSIEPFQMTFTLGDGEFFIDTNENGEIEVNGEAVGSGSLTVQTETGSSITDEQVEQQCDRLDGYLRQKHWQYIRDSATTNKSGRVTNQRFYCFLNYIGISGTFFVIASIDRQTDVPSTNTFVRLGNGFSINRDAQNVEGFEPATLELSLLRQTWNF